MATRRGRALTEAGSRTCSISRQKVLCSGEFVRCLKHGNNATHTHRQSDNICKSKMTESIGIRRSGKTCSSVNWVPDVVGQMLTCTTTYRCDDLAAQVGLCRQWGKVWLYRDRDGVVSLPWRGLYDQQVHLAKGSMYVVQGLTASCLS